MLYLYAYVTGTSPWIQINLAKRKHRIIVEARCPDGGEKFRQDFKFRIA